MRKMKKEDKTGGKELSRGDFEYINERWRHGMTEGEYMKFWRAEMHRKTLRKDCRDAGASGNRPIL